MLIVLVNPPPFSERERHWGRSPLLGLGYLTAALREYGHQVQVVDAKLTMLDIGDICRQVAALRPGLVGITCMTVEFPLVADLATVLKRSGAIPIIIGGAHANAVRGQVLEECAAVDYVCVGEGEALILELADAVENGVDAAEILGLVHRREGKIVENAPRPYPDDYDALPFPAWDLFPPADQLPIITHRGCPFHCNFCAHNSGFVPRYRSTANLLAELEHVQRRYAPRRIRIEDETFGLNLPRTRRLLEGIIARGLAKKTRFSAQTRVDRVDAAFLALLRRAGFDTLELGVESGNPDILERSGKGIGLGQVRRGVDLAKEAGLSVWCKFILGHPGETRRTLLDTAAFISSLNPDRLSVALMTPYPGTPIFEMARRGEGGYRMVGSSWRDFDKYSAGALELESVSLGELKALQLWCYLRLYVVNLRFAELVRFAVRHRSTAGQIVADTVLHLFRERLACLGSASAQSKARTREPGGGFSPERIERYFSRRAAFYEGLVAAPTTVKDRLARWWWSSLDRYRDMTFAACGELRDRRVLDLGCGAGDAALHCAGRGASVTAIDLSPAMLDITRRRLTEAGHALGSSVVCVDFLAWQPDPEQHFDIALALTIFDYAAEPARWVRRLARMCNELFVTFPARHALCMTIRRVHYALDGGVGCRFYARREVESLLADAGFHVLEIRDLGRAYWVHAVRTERH